MPLQIPRLDETVSRIETDIENRLREGRATNFQIGKSTQTIINIMARAIGGLIYLAYRLVAFASREVFISQASNESINRHGQEIGFPRNLATRSQYRMTVTGAPNTTIPSGTIYVFNSQQTYRTVAVSVIPAGGEININIESVETGTITNLVIGDTLQIRTPLSAVNEEGVIESVVREAANEETLEAYRSRLLEERRLVAVGGSADQWALWALEVAGITRAFAYRVDQGSGTVGVMLVVDGNISNIPPTPPTASTQQIRDVYDNLTGANRPRAAEPFVFSTGLSQYSVNVELPENANTMAIQDEAARLIREHVIANGAPLSTISRNDLVILLSQNAIETDTITITDSSNVTQAEMTSQVKTIIYVSSITFT